jgi:hypothetical protein
MQRLKFMSNEMQIMLWNIGLSLIITIIGAILKYKCDELTRISILLNKTREEVAREYVTKVEVHTEIDRLMSRLEILDAKLDRIIERG